MVVMMGAMTCLGLLPSLPCIYLMGHSPGLTPVIQDLHGRLSFLCSPGARLWVINESGNNPKGWTCLLAEGSHQLLSCLTRL